MSVPEEMKHSDMKASIGKNARQKENMRSFLEGMKNISNIKFRVTNYPDFFRDALCELTAEHFACKIYKIFQKSASKYLSRQILGHMQACLARVTLYVALYYTDIV